MLFYLEENKEDNGLDPHSTLASLYRYFYLEAELPNNLCSYFWKLAIMFVSLPFVWMALIINKGIKSVDEIIRGVYSCYSKNTPDLWTYEEKVNKVTKWCNTLLHLKLIGSDTEGKFNSK
jgi:hypothetical protein